MSYSLEELEACGKRCYKEGQEAERERLRALVREMAQWLRAYAPGLCEGLLARADSELVDQPQAKKPPPLGDVVGALSGEEEA